MTATRTCPFCGDEFDPDIGQYPLLHYVDHLEGHADDCPPLKRLRVEHEHAPGVATIDVPLTKEYVENDLTISVDGGATVSIEEHPAATDD